MTINNAIRTTRDNKEINYPTTKQASREGKNQDVQLWEFAVDQLHIVWDWTTSVYRTHTHA